MKLNCQPVSPVTAILFCNNDTSQLSRQIAGLYWCHEIILVPAAGFVTPGTLTALAPGIRVIADTGGNAARRKRYCIDQATHDWVLLLEENEWVSGELAFEIRMSAGREEDVHGYLVRRQDYFMGRALRPLPFRSPGQLRLFHRKWITINPYCPEGHITLYGQFRQLSQPLESRELADLGQYTDRINRESGQQALLDTGRPGHPRTLPPVYTVIWRFLKCFFSLDHLVNGRAGFYRAWLRHSGRLLYHLKRYQFSQTPQGQDPRDPDQTHPPGEANRLIRSIPLAFSEN
ncbi:MAG TPA: hypothetical protein VG870_13780 [Chitinophagaceae bacterium]|nr:hypothetical protein [Chitinophagaceae bacterium]